VGGDSLVGQALQRHCREAGVAVTVTTRRPGGDGVRLDLAAPDWRAACAARHDVAFLCAAVTDMRACQENRDASRLVNVVNTLELMRRLADVGTRSVFLSSSQVFDGEKPEPDEGSPSCPKNEYGVQKVMVEQAIAAERLPVAVLRLTKVLAERPVGVFKAWCEALLQGRPIQAATNMALSPVMAADVARAAARLGFEARDGVWHLGARDAVAYHEAARLMAERARLPVSLVQAEALTEAQVPEVYRHRHVTLSCRKIEGSLGFPLRASRDVLGDMFSGFSTTSPEAGRRADRH
jgi:dTDP-4-dehydrorhamnose reductase